MHGHPGRSLALWASVVYIHDKLTILSFLALSFMLSKRTECSVADRGLNRVLNRVPGYVPTWHEQTTGACGTHINWQGIQASVVSSVLLAYSDSVVYRIGLRLPCLQIGLGQSTVCYNMALKNWMSRLQSLYDMSNNIRVIIGLTVILVNRAYGCDWLRPTTQHLWPGPHCSVLSWGAG